MGDLIDDDMLNAFAVVAEPEDVAAELGKRFADVINRIAFYVPYASNPERWRTVMEDVKAL
jgi:hypothetical protein